MLKLLASQPYLSRRSWQTSLRQTLSTPLREYLRARGGSAEFRRLYYYLVQRGLIRRISGRGEATTVTITDKGLARLRQLRFEPLAKSGRWDGRWRLVALHFPGATKPLRATVNRNLSELGFIRLRPELWIHPLPCRAQIDLICETYGLDEELILFETADFDQHARYFDIFQNVILQ